MDNLTRLAIEIVKDAPGDRKMATSRQHEGETILTLEVVRKAQPDTYIDLEFETYDDLRWMWFEWEKDYALEILAQCHAQNRDISFKVIDVYM